MSGSQTVTVSVEQRQPSLILKLGNTSKDKSLAKSTSANNNKDDPDQEVSFAHALGEELETDGSNLSLSHSPTENLAINSYTDHLDLVNNYIDDDQVDPDCELKSLLELGHSDSQALEMAGNNMSTQMPSNSQASSYAGILDKEITPSTYQKLKEDKKIQESAQPESSSTDIHRHSSSKPTLSNAQQPSFDMESDLEVDAVAVSRSPSSSSSVSALVSSMSAISLSSIGTSTEGKEDEIVQNLSSSASGNSISRMSQTDDNKQVKKKRDFVIINDDDNEDCASKLKTHLLSKDIGIPDLTVDLFCEIPQSGTILSIIGTLPDDYNFILILITKTEDLDRRQKFSSDILIGIGLDRDLHPVVPVWSYKCAKKECKDKILKELKGFEYWRFTEKSNEQLYIQCVKRLVKHGRESHS